MRTTRAARLALLAPLLASLAAGGAAAAKLFSLSLEDIANGRAEVIDLTHDLQDGVPLYPGGVPFTLEPLTRLSDGYYMNSFASGEHTGTHVDAPAHFGKGLPSVDEIPARNLISNGIMIDARPKSSANPDYALTLPDILEWEKVNGRIPAHSLVVLNTGWHQRWENPDRYLNRDEAGTMHFPGFSVEALRHLLKERDVNGVAIDTLSIDPGVSATFEGHKVILDGGRYQVENLDNLDLLPVRGFTVIVAPMKISRGSGAPARVFAIVPR
ncbi:MAG TPA: cyclase family protein [Candidatus Polarisedimenticolia bacterium]|nr:cyclase family protein [Candidatus Polarisedimenticolia bacterium]